MSTLTIGELAKLAGVGRETVRFYEKQGLLRTPRRADSGYRQYDEDIIAVLRFIRRAKELGFTLKEVKGLLSLQSDDSVTRQDIRHEAKRKVVEIDEKIAELKQIRDSLQSLVEQCHGEGSIEGCPILDALQTTHETESHHVDH